MKKIISGKRSKSFHFFTFAFAINASIGTWKTKGYSFWNTKLSRIVSQKAVASGSRKSDLVKFLPDLTDSQLPEKEFFFGILNTLMSDEMRTLLADATKSRAPQNSEDHGDLIKLNQEFAKKVDLLFSMKSKEKCLGYLDKWTATKGRANHLLKKSSLLIKSRKSPKKFTADYTSISNFKLSEESDEEEKEKENRKNYHSTDMT